MIGNLIKKRKAAKGKPAAEQLAREKLSQRRHHPIHRVLREPHIRAALVPPYPAERNGAWRRHARHAAAVSQQ